MSGRAQASELDAVPCKLLIGSQRAMGENADLGAVVVLRLGQPRTWRQAARSAPVHAAQALPPSGDFRIGRRTGGVR